ACGMRAADSGSRVLITMDGYYRNGKMIDHKAGADLALEVAKKEGQIVDKVLVWRRHAGKNASASPFVKERDFFVDEILPNYSGQVVPPVPMDAEAPIFLMWRELPNTSRTFILRMSIGAWLISAGSRATPILCMVRWPWPLPACSTRVSLLSPTPAEYGESPNVSMSISSIHRLRPFVCCASLVPMSPLSTTTTSST